MTVLTALGKVDVRRRYFWARLHGGLYPADALLGIGSSLVSLGARKLCCLMGMAEDFAQAAEDLQELAGLRVSKERLRQITEREGQAVAAASGAGRLPPMWSAGEAVVDGGVQTRVYVGGDGVMVRTVTQEEKKKRREQHAIRRRQRGGAGIDNRRPLPPPRPGSDDRFKEMKIGLFYDQSKTHVHLFATEGNHERFGALLEQQAKAIGLWGAKERISLTDGGPWLRNQILEHLPNLSAMLLDFYHLSEHVWATARCCLGEGEAAGAWAEERLREMKETGPQAVLAAMDDLARRVRAEAKRQSLRLLRQYMVERWEMVEYPQALARGWDIGSGPTEAACKNLTLRLKRTGMKWDRDHAAAMMNLIACKENAQWKAYWQTANAA